VKVSLAGAAASQKVTDAHNGKFRYMIVKCNGIYLLDCEIDKSNRDESRS